MQGGQNNMNVLKYNTFKCNSTANVGLKNDYVFVVHSFLTVKEKTDVK